MSSIAVSPREARLPLAPLQAIQDAYRTSVTAGKGAVVFVRGPEGSGRTDIPESLARDLRAEASKPLVLGGFVRQGAYEPWSSSARGQQVGYVADRIADAAKIAGAVGVPLVGLAEQVISTGRAAGRLAAAAAAPAETTTDHLETLKRVLRRASAEHPVAWLVDDFDEAGGDLISAVLALAGPISVDLPVVIVATLKASSVDGSDAPAGPVRMLVDHLLRAGQAMRVPVPTLELADLLSWLGRDSRPVAERLHSLTGGLAGWTRDVWIEWTEGGVVVERSGGTWCFADGDDLPAAADPQALGRLALVLGEDEIDAQILARELLTFAAYEGRVFTAEVVAAAANRDRDEVINFLDDRLSSSVTAHPFVRERGSIPLMRGRDAAVAWRYAFVNRGDWLSFRRYGVAAEHQRERAGTVARALLAVYGGNRPETATALSELFAAAGDSVRAAEYSRRALQHRFDIWRRTRVELLSGQVRVIAAALADGSLPFSEEAMELVGAYIDALKDSSITRVREQRLEMLESLDAMLATAVDQGDRRSEAMVRDWRGRLSWFLRDRDIAADHRKAAEVWTELGEQDRARRSRYERGNALAFVSETAEQGRDELAALASELRRSGDQALRLAVRRAIADHADRHEKASRQERWRDLLTEATELGVRTAQSDAHLRLADIALEQGDEGAARWHLAEGLRYPPSEPSWAAPARERLWTLEQRATGGDEVHPPLPDMSETEYSEVLLSVGVTLRAEGDADGAARLIQRAFDVAQASNGSDIVSRAGLELWALGGRDSPVPDPLLGADVDGYIDALLRKWRVAVGRRRP
jgi:hypothetical protein